MYPTRIEMTDFLSHEATELDLTGVRQAVITGPVGAGKSSIIEAITWCLFGETRARTQDLLVREGADRATVTVDLVADGIPMSVTRSRQRGKSGTLSLTRGGEPWVTAEGTQHTVAETEAEIARILGVTYKALLAGPLMVQSDGGSLMSVQPRERRDLLLSLLVDTERWDAWAQQASEERKQAERDHAVASAKADPGQTPVRLRDAKEAHEQATREAQSAERNAVLYREAHEEKKSLLAKAQQNAARGEAAIARYTRARDVFAKAREEYQASEAYLMGVAGDVQRLLDSPVPEAPEPAPPSQDVRAARDAADAAVREAERAEQDIEDKRRTLRLEERGIEAALEAARSGKAVRCPDCGKEFVPGLDDDHIARLEARRAELDAAIRPLNQTLLDAQEALVKARADRTVKALDVKRAEDAFMSGGHAWNKWRDYQRALEAAKQKEADAVSRKDLLRRAVEEAAAEGKAAKAEWEQYRDVTKALMEAEEAEKAASFNVHTMESRAAQMSADASAQATLIAAMEAAMEEHEDNRVAALGLRERVAVLKELEGAFGPTGVPSMMLDSAIPSIEDEANAVLSRMPGGFRLSLRTQRATGKNTLVDAVDVLVDPGTGGERDYGMLSGGQRFRVDLALRIGLTRVLSAGRIRTLIVDEGLDRWQDPEGRGAVLDSIVAIMDDFDLVLTVSHHPDVVERFANRIEVSQQDGVSRVEVS